MNLIFKMSCHSVAEGIVRVNCITFLGILAVNKTVASINSSNLIADLLALAKAIMPAGIVSSAGKSLPECALRVIAVCVRAALRLTVRWQCC